MKIRPQKPSSSFVPKLPLINIKNGEQVTDLEGNVYEYVSAEDEWVYRGIIQSPPVVNEKRDGLITPDIYRKLVLLQELIDRGVDFSLFKIVTSAGTPYFYYFYSSDDYIKFSPEQFINARQILFPDVAEQVFPDRIDSNGFVQTYIRSASVTSTKYFVVDEFKGLKMEVLSGALSGAVFEIAGNSATDIIIWGNADKMTTGDQYQIVQPGNKVQRLRIEVDRARLYTKLVRNCCVGPKGLTGPVGASGLNGTPAANEVFSLPTSTKGGVFIFSTIVNTPIDTPISLRIFRGTTEIFELLFPLHPSVNEMTVSVFDSSITFEQTTLEVSYDPNTKEFSGSIHFTSGAGDISSWQYKARQQGPTGATGPAGKGFFDIESQVISDPAVRGTSAIVSLRKQANDSIVFTSASLFDLICVPNFGASTGSIPTNTIKTVNFVALQITTNDCKNIGTFQFNPGEFVIPDLDIPLWTPTADCVQAKRWSQYKFDWWNDTTDKYLFNISPTPKPPEQCCQEDFFFCPNVGDNPCGVNVERPIEPPNIPVPCACECASPIEQELTAGCVVLTPIDMVTQPTTPTPSNGQSTGTPVVQRTCNVDPLANLGVPGVNVANATYNADGTPITPRPGITQQSDGSSIAGIINGVTNEFTQEITVPDNCTIQVELIYDPDICGGEVQERQGCEYNDASSVNSTFIVEDIGDGTAVISDGGQAETTSIPASVSFTVTPTFPYESGDLENTQVAATPVNPLDFIANPSVPGIQEVTPSFTNPSPASGVINVDDCPPSAPGPIVDGPGAAQVSGGGSTVSRSRAFTSDGSSGSGSNPTSTPVPPSSGSNPSASTPQVAPQQTRKLRLTALVNTTKVNYCRGYRLIIIITCIPPTTLTGGSIPVTLTGSEPFTVITGETGGNLIETFLTGPGGDGDHATIIDCPTGSGTASGTSGPPPPVTLEGVNTLTTGEYEIQLPECAEDGEQVSTVVIAVLTDPIGNPVSGAIIQFSTESPAIVVPELVVTDGNGTARVTQILPLQAGTFQVTATGVSAPNNLPFSGVVVHNTTNPSSCQAPSIIDFTPLTQDVNGPVTITGSGFRGVTGVFFGGGPSATIESISDTQIVAIVPPGSTSGNVTVVSPVGTGTRSGFILFVPPPLPVITGFSPGAQVTGQNVTITGTGLTGAILVTFGGGPAAIIVTNTAIQIVATVPAGSASGNIAVVTPNGTAFSPGFTFIPAPVITGFSPPSQGVNNAVTITGTGLTGATLVTFGGGPAGLIIFNNAVQLIVDVPAGSANGTIAVTTPGGVATFPGFIFVPAPTITSFAPPSAAVGTLIDIFGTNFVGLTVPVTFGTGPVATGTVLTALHVQAVVPAGSSSGSVALTTPGGAASLGGFTFFPPPSITSFSPPSAGVGTVVDIFGTNFTITATVTFGGSGSVGVVFINSGHVQATVPVGSTSGSVSITTTGGGSTLGGFTFIPAPTLTSFTTPASVGNTVDVFGTNFQVSTQVKFGTGPFAAATFLTSGHIQVVVPNNSTSGNVQVSTLGGSASLAGFICTPTLTSVVLGANTFPPSTIGIGSHAPFSPPNAAPGGGDQITLNGTNLTGVGFGLGYGVSIGGAPATSGQPINGAYLISVTYSQVIFAAPAAGYFSGAPTGNFLRIITPDGNVTIGPLTPTVPGIVYLG